MGLYIHNIWSASLWNEEVQQGDVTSFRPEFASDINNLIPVIQNRLLSFSQRGQEKSKS